MYTPTHQELEEMGFVYEDTYKQWIRDIKNSNCNLYYKDNQELTFFITVHWDIWYGINWIYPSSRQDIEKLIRLLTYTE